MVNDASERMAGITINDAKYELSLTLFAEIRKTNYTYIYTLIYIFYFSTRPLCF